MPQGNMRFFLLQCGTEVRGAAYKAFAASTNAEASLKPKVEKSLGMLAKPPSKPR